MLDDLAPSRHRLDLGPTQDSFAQQVHLDIGTPPAARQSVPPLDSSDDNMAATADAPQFVRGHATYGDAEFTIRKVSRLLRSGKYARYRLDAKIATLSTFCDDATATRLDRLANGGRWASTTRVVLVADGLLLPGQGGSR